MAGMAAWSAYGGLIGFYPMNGNANDASGNGNNPTTVNNVGFDTGYQGQAATFNGTNSYVEVPININPSAMPLLTMGAWVLPDNVSPIRTIISHDNGGFDRDINIDSRGGCAFTGCYSAFTGVGVKPGTQAVANPAEWVFVAATYDGNTGDINLYVDNNTFSTNSKPGSGFSTTFFGRNPGFVEYWSGKIDNVFLFDEVLTKTQLDEIRRYGADALAPTPNGDVPEPSTYLLTGTVLVGGALLRRRLTK